MTEAEGPETQVTAQRADSVVGWQRDVTGPNVCVLSDAGHGGTGVCRGHSM